MPEKNNYIDNVLYQKIANRNAGDGTKSVIPNQQQQQTGVMVVWTGGDGGNGS